MDRDTLPDSEYASATVWAPSYTREVPSSPAPVLEEEARTSVLRLPMIAMHEEDDTRLRIEGSYSVAPLHPSTTDSRLPSTLPEIEPRTKADADPEIWQRSAGRAPSTYPLLPFSA